MTAKDIFRKTMPFCMAKLVLGGILVLVSVILFAILMGIGWLFGDWGMIVTLLIWLGGIKLVHLAIMQYAGYLVKAGHVAVIAEAMKTGQIPANQVNYGKQLVTQRFLTSNVYFAIDKLVTAAIKQVQNKIDKLGNKLDFIPGMETVAGAAKFFVDISLGYVDECCLGWTFYNTEQNAYKSAADGVVIYVQNWKVVLKSAAKTMAKVLIGMLVGVLIVFVPIGILFKILKWSPLAAFILACLVAWVAKFAFVDSYIMCQMMTNYMAVAPTTVLTVDLYGMVSNMSASFKELWQKGKENMAGQAQAAAAGGAAAGTYAAPAGMAAAQTQAVAPVRAAQAPAQPTVPVQPAAAAQKPVFCGQCGAKNERGTKFCGSCGAKLG